MSTPNRRHTTALCSDPEMFRLDGDIEIIGPESVRGVLKAGAADAPNVKRQTIEAVRAGTHVELHAKATVFRQKDGKPNRKFLRIAPAALESFAKSFEGKPFLVDHNSYEQAARMGSITSSELGVHGGTGWATLIQGLHAVKPNGVIGLLDGTIDRFSIGWSRGAGAVLCSVHKTNILSRERCSCWPGSKVEGLDGGSQVVEYEFQTPEGDETSGVNVPAVSGTKVEETRAALAAELGLDLPDPPAKDPAPMILPRLAAVLSLPATTDLDEGAALAAVENLRRGKLAAEEERDAALAKLSTATKAAAIVTSKLTDDVIAGAYKAGKLRHGRDENGDATASSREGRLRRIAKEDGLDALRAEVEDMPAIVAVKGQLRSTKETENEAEELELGDDAGDAALASAAAQLGLEPKDLIKHAEMLGVRGEI